MKTKKKTQNGKQFLTAVVANERGEIFDLEGYAAVGVAGDSLVPLTIGETENIPFGSEFMFLPDRMPVLFNRNTGKMETLDENPFEPGGKLFPVSAFNSPGYVISSVPAYIERKGAFNLPLFSYGAVGWQGSGFRSAVFQIDKERRQDLRLMPPEKIARGVETLKKKFPKNRLRRHLEKCALTYGCPAAKNFFVGRCEAPLPTSPQCNARCLGCLSLQSTGVVSHCQDRIDFMPTAQEIAEIALEHFSKVKRRCGKLRSGVRGRSAAGCGGHRAGHSSHSAKRLHRHHQYEYQRQPAGGA